MKLTFKRAYKLAILTGALSLLPIDAIAETPGFTLTGTLWESATDVDPSLLYAIAMAESQKYFTGGFIRPWPWSVNVDGEGHYFDSRQEAEAFVDDLILSGEKSIDIGPLQINTYWHGHRVHNPKDLFTLSTAIDVASNILTEAMASSPRDQALGIGRYHTWSDENRAREYGAKVIQYWEMILNEGGR